MKARAYFHSENISFRPLKEEHIPLVYKLHSLPEVAQFNTIGIPESEAKTAKILVQKIDEYDKTDMGWVLYDKEEEFIGEAGIRLSAERFKKGEISYSLLPNHWNKGLGTELAKRLLEYCFNSLNLHRVEAGVAADNLASIRVLEKAGMLCEGRHQKILPLQQGWTDNFSYAILAENHTKAGI